MDKPLISTVLDRLGVPPGKRGRTQCPIHCGENTQAFTYDDRQGVWFCFRCGIGGDSIRLAQEALNLDFKAALAFLGIDAATDQPAREKPKPKADPYQGLREWERCLRDQYHDRVQLEAQAARLLEADPDDNYGWILLDQAYSGIPLDLIEDELDSLSLMLPRGLKTCNGIQVHSTKPSNCSKNG